MSVSDTRHLEIVLEILKRVSGSGPIPAELRRSACVSKVFREASIDPEVLKHAGPGVLSVRKVMARPDKLSFLDKLRDSGSDDALYMVGMTMTRVWAISGDLLARAAPEESRTGVVPV